MKWFRWSLPAVAGVLVACVIYWHNPAWWWVEVHTGTVNESGPYYGFFSGFGSDLSELALLGAIAAGYRKINCEVHGCWRIGRHKTAAGHAVCRRHHPDGHLTAEAVKEHHHRALLLRHHAAAGERLHDPGTP